jgi:ATP-binding cassette subfamily C exporter for protease/lipase
VRFDRTVSPQVFEASYRKHLNPHEPNPSGAFSDLTELRQFLTGQGLFAFFDMPWVFVYITVLFFLHPFLGLSALVFCVLLGLTVAISQRYTHEPHERLSQAYKDSSQFLEQKLRNVEVVEAMGMFAGLQQRWRVRHAVSVALYSKTQRTQHVLTAWTKFSRYTMQSLSLGAGALLVIQGELSAGAMIASNVLMSKALAPIDALTGTWKGMVSAAAAFWRLDELLDLHHQVDKHAGRPDVRAVLRVNNLVATTPERNKPILNGLSFEAWPGSLTVVLGHSGSGKSTLARVLLGIWPQYTGQVMWGSQPMADFDRVTIGERVGYLPQDVALFDGTVSQNIARMQEVDAEKVIAAAMSADLHHMILRLPQGYDTPIGEGGMALSGGQRQRLGLARAIYGEPDLVVLDEPNANLDDVGQAALAKVLDELKRKGCMALLITHRPDVLGMADQVLVMSEGRLQYSGPPQEMKKRA